MTVRVQQEAFQLGDEVDRFAQGVKGAGAVVTFTGIVRDVAQGGLSRMVIEHYPGMTERALTQIREDAMGRWPLVDALIIHRYGEMAPDDMIMMVATASAHRVAAFEAAEFLMDYLKSRAPFWKQEVTADEAQWVESKAEDEDALRRW